MMERLAAYFNMATAPHKIVRLERISDDKGVGLQRCRIMISVTVYLLEVS